MFVTPASTWPRLRLLATAVVVAATASAETVSLPASIPLEARELVLRVSHADLQIVQAQHQEPGLRASVAAGKGEAVLELRASGDRLEVEHRGPETLRIDVTVAPHQRLRLEGDELSVSARGAGDPAPSAPQAPDPGAPAGGGAAVLELDVTSSRLALTGLEQVVAVARDSVLWVDDSSGSVSLRLARGSAEISHHRGDLELESEATRITVVDLDGTITFGLRGGSLELAEGSGSCEGQVVDAQVRLSEWRGKLALDGERTGIDIGNSTADGEWRLAGTGLDLRIESSEGDLTTDLTGGRLQVSGLRGKLAVTGGEQAELTLRDVDGATSLVLQGGSQATVRGMPQSLEAKIVDSALEVEGVKQLTVEAARSQLFARGVERLGAIEMSDSELELDLAEIRHPPALTLRGESRARVLLPYPCLLRVNGIASAADGDVRVRNCELSIAGQPRSSQRVRRLQYAHRRILILTATIEEGVRLEVEALP
jgi:hypothetical protein